MKYKFIKISLPIPVGKISQEEKLQLSLEWIILLGRNLQEQLLVWDVKSVLVEHTNTILKSDDPKGLIRKNIRKMTNKNPEVIEESEATKELKTKVVKLKSVKRGEV
jgi:hypothetical protein